MVAAGPDLVELHIEHVREPSQRVPVALVEGGKGPVNAGLEAIDILEQRQAAEDVEIFLDIARIVEINEVHSPDGPIARHDDHDKKNRDQRLAPGPANDWMDDRMRH